MSKKASKAKAANGEKETVSKTFRIPRELDEVLIEDASSSSRTATDQFIWILRKYAEFDRLAQRFGFATVNKPTLRALFEAIPEEKARELGISQSDRVEALTEFWYGKKDLDSVLGIVDMTSKYGNLYGYTTTRTDHELTIVIRTDLGAKAALFAANYWKHGIAKALGVTPKVEVVENQVTLAIPL